MSVESQDAATVQSDAESGPRRGRALMWCTGILAATANALVLLGWLMSATVAECEGDISLPLAFLGAFLGAVTAVVALVGAAFTRRWAPVAVAMIASIPVALFVLQGLDSRNGYWLYNYCSS